MDQAQFRSIMREHASGVSVVCTAADGYRAGLTATAVCPVTDDPPTMLVCVNKNAGAHDVIDANHKFSINFLGDKHKDIACIFAGQCDLKGEERFAVQDHLWSVHASGMPRLEGAIASLDCTVAEKQQFSSHTIFIGQVNAGSTGQEAAPLLYFRCQFRTLAEL